MNTTSINKPEVFLNLGNGKFYYNYNIRPVTRLLISETGEQIETQQWEYMSIKMNGKPDYNTCAKNVIRAYISESDEFSLINDYNAYKLGLTDDQEIEENYKNYLQVLNEIKSNVRKDFGLN